MGSARRNFCGGPGKKPRNPIVLGGALWYNREKSGITIFPEGTAMAKQIHIRIDDDLYEEMSG